MKPNSSQASFFVVLRHAAGFALQWRLLLLWVIALAIPTLIMALPFWQIFGAALNYNVHAAELAQHLKLNAINDVMAVLVQNKLLLQEASFTALLLTLLLSPFLSGMIITAARAPQPLTLGKLMHGGLSEYWRLARMLIWALIPFGVAGGIGAAAMHFAADYADQAILQSNAELVNNLALALLVLLLVLADAVVDAGRAQLIHFHARRSAFKAGLAGLMLVLRRPLSALGLYVLITLIGLLLAAVLGLLRINLHHVEAWGFIVALVLTQLIVISMAWLKAARIYALAAIVK